jgi:hypothetical protein
MLLLVVPAALLFGLYGRFAGIGRWPLGVDEFYISRSIDHVLATGLPAFPCGGFYTRGALFQYLVAALRVAGQPPELAGRLVAGVSSLAVLPAAYLIGKRIHGSIAGWLTVIVLLVSIWEIEMARFGRMYAPFQAVFSWYLVFYLRYAVDKDMGAMRWMIALSLLGILTWEGGVLLGVANIFAVLQAHDGGRLRAVDWRLLAGLVVLLALLYLASRDLRGLAGYPETDAGAPVAGSSATHSVIGWSSALRRHRVWVLVFLVPLGIAAASLRFIWSYRRRWLTFLGLWAVLLAAVAHVFTAAAGMLALMLLLRLIDMRELAARSGRLFLLALLMLLGFWLAYEYSSGHRMAQSLFGFPDLYWRIGWPWGRTLPVETAGIGMAGLFWFCQAVAAPEKISASTRTLTALLLLLVLAVAAIPTERVETRYAFFLYPALLIMAISAILELGERLKRRRAVPAVLLAGAPLLCFAATEDFQVRQVAHIDSAEAVFRVGMSSAVADHYYPRNDMRSVAGWLRTHVQPSDTVISGIPNLDQYYGGFTYFYLDEDDNRYDAYVCRDGRTERWTSHPVLYKVDSLRAVVGAGHTVYAALYPDVEARLRSAAMTEGWTITSAYTAMDGISHIVRIDDNSGGPAAN